MIDEIPTSDDESGIDSERIAAICSLRSNEYRLAVIEAVNPGSEMHITQLISDVATDSDDLERVRGYLHYTHLPQLDDADLIEYDWNSGEVWCGEKYG